MLRTMHRQISGFAGLLLGLSPPVSGDTGLPGGVAPNSAFELCTGVVVDPATAKLYLMNREGGIDSVSVTSGELLWSTGEAAKPLALYGDLLVAQVERSTATQLEIVLLDTLSGERTLEFPIDLPPGVYGAVDEGMGTSLSVRAIGHEGEPWIAWEVIKRYVQGAAPAPDEPLETRQEGTFRLDMLTHQAVAADGAVFDPAPLVLPSQVQAWSTSNVVSGSIFAVGGVFAATQAVTAPGREQVVLKRWDVAGVPLPDVAVFSRPHVLEFPSADGRHLLIAERAAPGQFTEYEWFIAALETGERLGQISHHQSHARFLVSDNAVTYVERPYGHLVDGEWISEPRKLKTILLGSAALVWQRPLRDTHSKGSSRHEYGLQA